jgi:hypothetical protein
MRNILVEKNCINLIAALGLAILPLLMAISPPGLSVAKSNSHHAMMVEEASAE